MKNIKLLTVLSMMLLLFSCDVDYKDNPNEPTSVPTSSLFNNNLKNLVDNTRNGFSAGRFTYCTMQYWQQSEYGDEDRYVYRESMRQNQNNLYNRLANFKEIIDLNTNEDTKAAAAASGSNDNQIAVCRIMMAYTFDYMASTWGDIPYYSYGSDNPDFQALHVAGFPAEEQILAPKYATQEQIYTDILKELGEAAKQLDPNSKGMDGDNLYGGDVEKWKLFANSLRLRIANKIKGANPTLAQTAMNEAITSGVFTSNADNAMFGYETEDKNASMMYRAWHVNNRSDFAVSHSFITLLKGENLVDTTTHTNVVDGANPNPFKGIVDPRLPIYAKANSSGNYVGMFIAESSADAATFTYESLPGAVIIDDPTYSETLLEYAEICFIMSELNNWDQGWYEKGIRASMEKWGVSSDDIDSYIAAVPAASKENVLTQKYIALYMQGQASWAEYRRTGYPKTLIPPFKDYALYIPSKDLWLNKAFNPLVEEVTDLPYRMRYPAQEQTLNKDNRKEAVARLENGDVIYSKLWWDVN